MFTKQLFTKGDCTVCYHLKSLYSVFPLKQQTLAATIYCFLICSQPIISLRMHLISKDTSSRHCCLPLCSSNCALGDSYFCLPFCMFISSPSLVLLLPATCSSSLANITLAVMSQCSECLLKCQILKESSCLILLV